MSARFEILGPLKVAIDGQPVSVRGDRRVALMVRLLISANQTVPAARLLEDVWEGGEPPRAGSSLQTLVSLLRRQIGGPRIATRPAGYALVVRPGEFDVADFEEDLARGHEAIRRGQREGAEAYFDTALGRWRGPALVDVEGVLWAQGEATRLNELCLSAHDDLLDVRLALGRHGDVVAHAEAAVKEQPLRERRWATLMLALYRCGRQAEALRAYQGLRSLLGEELGIEPCAELTALEEAIILQKPHLDWTGPAGSPAPSGCLPPVAGHGHGPPAGQRPPLPSPLKAAPTVGLLGRHLEVQALVEAYRRMAAGTRTEVALISGEAGIGKTCLAAHLARLADLEESLVLLGRCQEHPPIPYLAFVEALGHYLTHAEERDLVAHVAGHGGELRRLVPGVMRLQAATPDPRRTDPETERYLLYGAVAGLLHQASSHHPVVLVLDDLQWADESTLGLLRHILTAHDPARMLVIGTYRDRELDDRHPLSQLLAALHRHDGVTRLVLRGLEDGDVAAFMEALSGHRLGDQERAAARAVAQETGGNPFFVGELLRHLVDSHVIDRHPDRGGEAVDLFGAGLPDSVSQVLGQRVASLGGEGADILAAAAVIGFEFDLDLVARVTRLEEDAVLDLLEASGSAALTADVLRQPGRFQFAHALVQHALYERLSPTRKARLHRAVAEHLVASGVGAEDRAAEVAQHFILARQPEQAGQVATYGRRAGDQALEALAPTEAVRWYRQALKALEALAEGHVDHERARCLTGLGDALRQLGDPSARETLLQAAALAQNLDDGDLLARAALANHRGMYSGSGMVDQEQVATLEAALASLGESDSSGRARLLGALALEVTFAGDYKERRRLADQALSMARRLDDPATLLDVLLRRRLAIWTPATFDEVTKINAEAHVLAAERSDPVGSVQTAIFTRSRGGAGGNGRRDGAADRPDRSHG